MTELFFDILPLQYSFTETTVEKQHGYVSLRFRREDPSVGGTRGKAPDGCEKCLLLPSVGDTRINRSFLSKIRSVAYTSL